MISKIKPTLASKLASKPKATPAPKNDNKKKANDNGKAVEEKKNNGQAKVNGNGNGKSNGNGKDANGKAKAGSNGKVNNNGNGKATVEKKANGEAKTNGGKTVKTEKAAVSKVTTKTETGKAKPLAKPQLTKDKTDKMKANAAPSKSKATKTVVEKVQTKVAKAVKVAAITQKTVVFKPTPAPLPLPSKPKVLDVNNVKSMSKSFPPFDKAAVSGTIVSSPEIPKKKPTNGYQQVQNQEPVLAIQSCISNLIILVQDCIQISK